MKSLFPWQGCSKRYAVNIFCVLCAVVFSRSSHSTSKAKHTHIDSEDRNEPRSVYIVYSHFDTAREAALFFTVLGLRISATIKQCNWFKVLTSMLLLFICVYSIYRMYVVSYFVESETYFCNIKKQKCYLYIWNLSPISIPKVFTSLHYICNVLERFSIFAKCSKLSMLKHYSEFKMSQWYISISSPLLQCWKNTHFCGDPFSRQDSGNDNCGRLTPASS